MIVRTLSDAGTPMCPVCEDDVAREGEFCSSACWQHFHTTIYDMGTPMIEMNYLDIEEQPWYGDGT